MTRAVRCCLQEKEASLLSAGRIPHLPRPPVPNGNLCWIDLAIFMKNVHQDLRSFAFLLHTDTSVFESSFSSLLGQINFPCPKMNQRMSSYYLHTTLIRFYFCFWFSDFKVTKCSFHPEAQTFHCLLLSGQLTSVDRWVQSLGPPNQHLCLSA